MNEAVVVETLAEVSPADAAALARLLGQLSTTASFDPDRIRSVIEHESTDLVVARVDGDIVGMATFVSVPLPTGLRGHVEDVVVDGPMRGRGIARKLLETMTSMADARGLRTLDLTSRPSRETALRLYEAVGFRRRDTNTLRYTPSKWAGIAARLPQADPNRALIDVGQSCLTFSKAVSAGEFPTGT